MHRQFPFTGNNRSRICSFIFDPTGKKPFGLVEKGQRVFPIECPIDMRRGGTIDWNKGVIIIMDTSTVSPVPSVNAAVPVQSPPAPDIQPVPSFQYASFGQRLLALFIDGLIVGVVSWIVSMVTSLVTMTASGGLSAAGSSATSVSTNPMMVTAAIINLAVSVFLLILGAAYYIYMTGSRGQTLGKMIMKIKVVKSDGQPNIGYGTAFLRETIGRLLSSLIIDLGYLWMLWDSNKQTWHDKIAGTIVVKI
jgi:uncharacterized RDD family membrane protein YckC